MNQKIEKIEKIEKMIKYLESFRDTISVWVAEITSTKHHS